MLFIWVRLVTNDEDNRRDNSDDRAHQAQKKAGDSTTQKCIFEGDHFGKVIIIFRILLFYIRFCQALDAGVILRRVSLRENRAPEDQPTGVIVAQTWEKDTCAGDG